uniref:KRAB domain-containing protein n=1 Tax=Naja naja TaxID=35670 RepID=A0A8C6X1J4_NAJNA
MPLDQGKLMILKGPVSFEEVTIHFNSEEWLLLDPSQKKALHSEVMLENHRNVVFLGKSVLLCVLWWLCERSVLSFVF